MLRQDRAQERRLKALENLQKARHELQDEISHAEYSLILFHEGKMSLPTSEPLVKDNIRRLKEKLVRQNYEVEKLLSEITKITGSAKILQDSTLRQQKRSAYKIEDCLDAMETHER